MAKGPNLVARDKEIAVLMEAEKSTKAEFIAVYGRRRIGKTFLIREYFQDRPFYFEFVGAEKSTTSQQIKNFIREVIKKFRPIMPFDKSKIQSWSDAFYWLTEIIEASSTDPSTKKVIFFDELPWLASRKSGFLEAITYFWNSFAQKQENIILVVCGSAASWMIKHVVNNKGGLHNRTTRRISMSPFTLNETQEYLVKQGVTLIFEQITEIFMATGGVAFYLDHIKPGESAAQYINNSFFSPTGVLRDEFDSLFESLFENYRLHVDIVKLLAKHPFGLNSVEISENLKKSSGGGLSNTLKELEKSDFVLFNPKLGKKKREGTYRLVDEYSLFYLTWVEPQSRTFTDGNYWQKQVGQPRYNSWLGHAFENLCFKHSAQIVKALGISGITTQVFGFWNKNAQIDMIIDRHDKAMNVCEMKYTAEPFAMTEAEAKKMRVRKAELLANLKTNRQIFITLITPFPAKRNKHYLGLIDVEINLHKLFT